MYRDCSLFRKLEVGLSYASIGPMVKALVDKSVKPLFIAFILYEITALLFIAFIPYGIFAFIPYGISALLFIAFISYGITALLFIAFIPYRITARRKNKNITTAFHVNTFSCKKPFFSKQGTTIVHNINRNILVIIQ